MNISIKDSDLEPTSFTICNFYGEDTCFCWNNNKFIMFPYMMKKCTPSLPVYLAPGPVKTIHCFSNRVFFVCLPRGVYKLSKDGRFSVLSKSAISVGPIFFEILALKNDGLYLENKQSKSSKLLLHLSPTLQQCEDLCTFPLHSENSEQEFRNILLDGNDTKDNLCLISSSKKLFLLTEVIHIIYNCDHTIINIIPVQNNGKLNALILVTDTDAIIFMYAKDKKLNYKKIYLGIEIKTLCAGFDQQCADKVWIIYSNGSKLYYMTLMLSTEVYNKVKVEEKSLICMQYYKEDIFVGLNNQKKMYELSTNIEESVTNSQVSKDNFISLHSGMLKDTDMIVDQICERAKELQSWNEKLIAEEEKLYKINLYASKQKIQACPKMTVHRIANQLFLNINFHENLPKNIYIICYLSYNNETVFSIKEIASNETCIDLSVPKEKLSNSLKFGMDLITIINKGQPWFLIKNFVKDPVVEKKKKQHYKKSKTSFINAKINVIKNLMVSGNLSMQKLSEIKQSIRKEICDI